MPKNACSFLRLALPFLLLAAISSTPPAGAAELAEVSRLEKRGGDVLRLDLRDTADAARITRLAIHDADGLRHLEPARHLDDRRLELTLGEGCAVVLVDTVKSALKLLTCATETPGEAALEARFGAGVASAKAGGRAELRPFANPLTLKPGHDLPVRVYVDNEARADAVVEARGPDGQALRATTDEVGVAVLRLPTAGRWTLTHRHDGFTAELEFELAPAAFWKALPPSPVLRPAPARQSRAPEPKADEPRWRALGPLAIRTVGRQGVDVGRLAALAVGERNPPRLYLGAASGGVWRSDNNGGSWRDVSSGLPHLAIGAVAVDPRDDRIVYAGSGEANNAYHSLYGVGLYKSTNGGETWRVLARQDFAGRAFSRLVVSPFDRNEIWAAVGRAGGTFDGQEGARLHPSRAVLPGLFRSRDGGETWRHVRAGNGVPALHASDVDLDPRDRNRVFVAIADPFAKNRNGLYRSTDAGKSFERVLDEVAGAEIGRITVDIAPTDPRRIYALLTRPASRQPIGGFFPPGSSLLGLYRSNDGGDSWTLMPVENFQSQQGIYNSAVVVHPQNPDVLFLGGVTMLRTVDGGQSFQDATPPHVDVHDLAFDRTGRLLAATDGGIFASDDLGRTWQAEINRGLSTVQFYPGLSVHPDNPEIVFGGTQDNGTNVRLEDSLVWTRIFGGDGGVTAVHPERPELLFVQFQGTDNLFRSEDGGLSFLGSSTGIDPDDRNCFLPPFLIDPQNPERMLYATERVYESTNAGANWAPISDDLTAGAPAAVRSLALSRSDSNVVYATTNDGRVLVSEDAGHTFRLSRDGIFGWPRVMRQVAVDPVGPAFAALAVMGFNTERVMITRDRGQTWEAVGDGLPNLPVNTVAIHRIENRRWIFAGTDRGVYVSPNNGKTWRAYGTAGPRAPVMDLVVDLEHGRLVAGTLGRGVFEVALPR